MPSLKTFAKGKGKSYAKASLKSLGDTLTLGQVSAIYNELLFTNEQNRVDVINKKVIQNCIDIRNLAKIFSGDGSIDTANILKEITDRVDNEECENSLKYNEEIDELKRYKELMKQKLQSTTKEEDEILSTIWEDINKVDSPPTSRPSSPNNLGQKKLSKKKKTYKKRKQTKKRKTKKKKTIKKKLFKR